MNSLKLPTRILATGDFRVEIEALLAEKLPDLEIQTALTPSLEQWQWAQAWIGLHPPKGIENSHLPWYHLICDGYNHAASQLNPKAENGALITHTVGKMPEYIGSWVAGYLLADLRLHRLYQEQQNQRLWKQWPIRLPEEYPVLLIGAGNIAQGVAKTLKSLGFPISAVNSSGKQPKSWLYSAPVFDKIYAFSSLTEVICDFKVVIMALPLTEKTRNIADSDFFAPCREIIFMNVGRGPTVSSEALKAALDGGKISHCYLDVTAKEPLPKNDWLWSHPQVTLSPHVAGPTVTIDGINAFLEVYEAITKGISREKLPLQIDTAKGY